MLYNRDWTGLPVHTHKAKVLAEKLREHDEQEKRLATASARGESGDGTEEGGNGAAPSVVSSL